MLTATTAPGELLVRPAVRADAGELLTLQRACWLTEQQENPGVHIPAAHETLAEVVDGLAAWSTYVVRDGARLVGSVRARPEVAGSTVWEVGRLMVAPDRQGGGLGRRLLEHALDVAPDAVTSYRLLTGRGSVRNHRLYRAAGFRARPELDAPDGAVWFTRPRRR
nr:GNAT family N-acetyltransferase [Nocardioides perillae]